MTAHQMMSRWEIKKRILQLRQMRPYIVTFFSISTILATSHRAGYMCGECIEVLVLGIRHVTDTPNLSYNDRSYDNITVWHFFTFTFICHIMWRCIDRH